MSDDVKKVLRALKVGDPCIVVETGYRMNDAQRCAPTTVTAVGRRWLSVAQRPHVRFDRDDGFNDSTGNYQHTPRVSTQALLEAEVRHRAVNEKVRNILTPHSYWEGHKLSADKLERIFAILEEPDARGIDTAPEKS